ncbi:MAG TPA: hypothetical protein VLM85_22840 [Polyangiaceae bacterium]|nr:hypothetical protein [Polyangiaceae bacterium]
MRVLRSCLVAAVLTTAGLAHAGPLLAPDAALEAKAASYQRQEQTFSTRENGLFLDTFVNPADVALVQSFFAQTAQLDFTTFSGRDPYSVIDHYDEYGDEGNFAGVASVGLAARLIWLRQNGGSVADVQAARDAAVRAARAWHVYGAIGGPGVVARGVRRVTPWNPTDAPFPGPAPIIVPLKDGGGNPLPATKQAVWRAPVAPGFDGWVWFDDTSKDQVSGYALASAWLWDALHDDPAVPADVPGALSADLVAFAKALMVVAPETGVDLCIRDADGRLTSFYDLNPRILSPGGPPLPDTSTLRNGFNAALALGILRAAYHASGDPDVGAYYYQELVSNRDFLTPMKSNTSLVFLGPPTNYSNVNMFAIALATLGRFETDPQVRSALGATLQQDFWSTGDTRDVQHVQQAWFDAVYGSYALVAQPVSSRIASNLGGFNDPPAFDRDRVNCDAQEIDAGQCLAVDGTTVIKLAAQAGWGGGVVAQDIVPMAVRPDSDFEWRSDPHRVNGTADNRMNPGGDFLAAYWLARLSDTDASKNLSPYARPPLPYGPGDQETATPPASGCGCNTTSRSDTAWALLVFGAALVASRAHKRRMTKRGAPRHSEQLLGLSPRSPARAGGASTTDADPSRS